MRKLLLTVITYLSVCYTSLGDDSRIIRRLYLDTIGMPPTIEELDWYSTYNKVKGYEMAVDWVLTKTGDVGFRKFYLSEIYKTRPQSEIPQTILDSIIKYQVGKLYLTDEQAIDELIKLGDLQFSTPLDIIDYFSVNMMARVTHIDEANLLLRVFRSFKNEKEGYREVISLMKDFRDYRYK